MALSLLSKIWFAFIAGLIIAGLVYTYSETVRRQEMYDQCVADGKKEYECYALLRQDNIYIAH